MLSAYCAAKHGVIGLTRALQEELRDTPLMATAICPGSVDTEMLQIGMPGGTPSMTPQDIADVVLFLAQDAPHAIKGAVVDVFG
jgi:NAD(P)-dependent dehydrogenase (short-subunit alcohol dehydrogenase family)